MPTLVRLLTVLAAAAGIVFAIMAALVFLVEPTPHPVSVEVPIPPRPARVEPAAPAPAAAPVAEADGTPLTGSIPPPAAGAPPVAPGAPGASALPAGDLRP